MFRGVELLGVIIKRVLMMSRGERISAVMAGAATATPIDRRGFGESRVAAESVMRVGSGRERMAERREEVQDSRVWESIQWMKEAFCPVECEVNHVILEIKKWGSGTFPYSPNSLFVPQGLDHIPYMAALV